MSELNQILSRLSPEQRELFLLRLDRLHRDSADSSASLDVIPRRSLGTVGEAALLSFAQERIWFLEQLTPGTPAHNIPTAVHLAGILDQAALEEGLNRILDRHETLRASFASEAGQPRQRVASVSRMPVPGIDLRGLREPFRGTLARDLAAAEVGRSFDLTAPPLLRALLIILGDREHVLVLTLHHIAADGWSRTVLFRELVALYRALAKGEAPRLPDLDIQYGDFVHWQRERLQGAELQRQVAHWRERLDGASTVLQLPSDRPRPAVQSHRGARRFATFEGLDDALRGIGRQRDATLFMVLLAAFEVLLHRYTGRQDLIIGSPTAGRNRAELEALIGLFVNTLALRADLSGRPTFLELLERVREVTLEAFNWQELPFEKLVEELQPERELSHAPLVQVMFILHNTPLAVIELPALTLTLLESDRGGAVLDLTLAVTSTERGLLAVLDYSTDLFDADTVDRMLGHYRTLLEGIAADPGQGITSLPILPAAEREQLLRQWNDTVAPYPREATVHGLFEAQAARTPEAVALLFEGEMVSYCTLDRRANHLAHRLRELGVGPEVPVGIALPRSVEMVAGLLGILKAGGVYVPLDPAYPRQRLASMIGQSGLRLVLAGEELAEDFASAEVRILRPGRIVAEEREPPPCGATAGNLAYVLFTSGSTGEPKGVQVPHRSLVNFLSSMATRPGLTEHDNLLAVTTLSFDIAALELFLPLIRGARVTLASAETTGDGAALAAALEGAGATAMQATPATWRLLLEAGWTGRNTLHLFCGGEALPWELAHRLLPRGASLWNLYGPTETTVWSAVHKVEGGAGGAVGLGEPIANTRIHVLDAELQPVPLGVPGQLYIAGDGLSRGYCGRPGQTAEAFLPDPFAEAPGERLYRTGDLVRRLPGGDLAFLGRIDHQVKVRGFRIETGEIETALEQHPAVGQAVVVLRETRQRAGDARLVAYLVPAQEGASAGELRSFLRGRLPEYMVPSLFVLLRSFPLTPSGKVDRKALPEPEAAQDVPGAAATPRSPIEEVLAGIWSEVLDRQGIGIRDSFFELGGHSLLATQVFSRIREIFGVELPLQTLFEEPTVAGLAERVDQARRRNRGLQAPPLVPVPRGGDLPLSFAQQRLWFLDQLVPGNPFYNVPGAIRLSGTLDGAALEASLAEVIRRHEALRTTFTVRDGRPLQTVSQGVDLRLPLVDLQELPGSVRYREVESLAAAESCRTFDLARGPLIRAALLRLEPAEHALVLTLHHVVSDGWSIGVLVREVGALYEAFSSGRPSPLPELAVQYPDFAVWQRRWLQGEVLERQLTYWKGQLEGTPMLQLPTDLPRPPVPSYRGRSLTFALPHSLSGDLRTLGRRQGGTLFMVLLAGFASLLRRYAGQEDVAIGMGIANRNRAEVEPLIGFFVNTLVMRCDLSGHPPFEQLVHRIRDMALEGYAHQDLPFEHLVEVLQPERDMSRQPLFQVMFTLHNVPMPVLELPSLTLAPLDLETGTSKFDLFLSMVEKGDTLLGRFEYNTDLFLPSRIARMAGHLQRLLESAMADPGCPISRLDLLPEAERQQLLLEWNDTLAAYPRQAVHEVFESRAEEAPRAVAVVWEEDRLTYGELNRRANRLAHHLRRLGVGTEVLVGLCVERSPDMVVALLAILKAGGAYLPLDPGYPRERLAFMLEDARAPVLVTVERLRADLPESGARPVLLDLHRDEIQANPEENLDGGAGPDALAYAIYTSGSTGRPKGIAVCHRNVVRLVRANHYADLSAGRVWLQAAPVSFDASTLEIWGSLLNGACLVLLPSRVPSLTELGDTLGQHGVDSLWLTAGLFHQMVDGHLEGLRTLRQLLVGGDVLSVPHVRRALEALDCRVINGYGPTENTTFTTCHAMSHPGQAGSPVAIGRPIGSTAAYLLDADLRPMPLGVPGELYAGGDGVARGYLGRPDLTAERFVPDPFAARPGGRMYRTGDLAAYGPAGLIEFLGRNDHQVKVRGFRIELGEIETALQQHPVVRQAVVLAREDKPGDKRLVVYVTSDFRRAAAVEPVERAEWQAEHVSQWESLFDSTYATAAGDDPAFNIRGWISSYTEAPIPAEEMRDWVDDTVDRILALAPSRVLEIGCGTGLLLFRLAPHCERYRATDFSQMVLHSLARHVAARGLHQVELGQGLADDFSEVAAGSFDAVVLNSVVQYFPDADYLLRVLEGAVRAVAPGGFVFVGDLRSLPLLEVQHTSVELHQAPASLPAGELRRRIQQRVGQEEELLVDPALFSLLKRRLPGVSCVEIFPKRGRRHNELTRFRYQAILQVGPRPEARLDSQWQDWSQDRWTLTSLRRHLAEAAPRSLAIEGIPNARLAADLGAMELLAQAPETGTVGELRAVLERSCPEGVDPMDLWAFEEELPYRVRLSWARHGTDGACDAVFLRLPAAGEEEVATVLPFPEKEVAPADWQACTNDPLQGKFARRLVPWLREHLRQRLPDHMVPASFVLMDAFPLDPNGKVDRRALPTPEGLRPVLEVVYEAPRSELERAVGAVWLEVLRLDRIGRNDNFFDLGGNSLLLVQVHRRLQEELGRDLALMDLFDHPTVGALSGFLSQDRDGGLSSEKIEDRARTRRDLLHRQRQARPAGRRRQG